MGVNNLPRVATQQCTGWELNLQPLDHKSYALPLHYRATSWWREVLLIITTVTIILVIIIIY